MITPMQLSWDRSRSVRWAGVVATSLLIAAPTFAQERKTGYDPSCRGPMAALRALGAVHGEDTLRIAPAWRDSLRRARAWATACVEHADLRTYTGAIEVATPTALALAVHPFHIPEYHDEGRLPAGGNNLGPYTKAFASPFLASLTRKAQFVEHGFPGALVAIVIVDEPKLNEAYPASYSNLQLLPGTNCFWLFAETKNSKYQAFVSQVGEDMPCDRDAVPPDAAPLGVDEQWEPGFPLSEAYPPVTRLDTDAAERLPMLGVKCGTAYCEIGVGPGVGKRPTWMPHAGGTPPREKKVKGWHDEQRIAVRDAVTDTWHMSAVQASIVPVTSAADLDSSDFHGRWQPVAKVHLGGLTASDKLFKWGMQNRWNLIEVSYDGSNWQMAVTKMVNENTPVGTRRVWPQNRTKRMIHYDAGVPPTARFRFTGIDDGLWVPCGNACCRSDGGIQ